MPQAGKRAAPKKRRSALALKPDQIQIDFVVLGDYAQAVQGKLHLIGGGWNLWHAQQYPNVVHFGLGIGILVPWSLTNRKHGFRFVIRASEGAELANGGGEFEMGRPPGTPPGMTQRVVIGLSGELQLSEPGTYEIIVTAASDEKRVTFEALPVPPRR